MTEKAPLPLEPYATLSAEIDAGEPLDAVIERGGVTKESWAAAQAFWLKLMADEAETQRFETTTRYQTHYRTHKKLFLAERERKRKAAERVAPPPLPLGPLEAAERALASTPGRSIAAMPLAEPPRVDRPVAAPSFDRGAVAGSAPSVVAPPAMVAAGASVPRFGGGVPATPPHVPAAVAPPARADGRSEAEGSSDLASYRASRAARRTMSIDASQLSQSATPFVAAPGAPVPPPNTMPVPPPNTMPVPPPNTMPVPPPNTVPVPPPNTMPVPSGPTTAPAPPPAVMHASRAAHPPQQLKKSLLSTLNVNLDDLRDPAMPFAGGAPAARAPLPPVPPAAHPAVHPASPAAVPAPAAVPTAAPGAVPPPTHPATTASPGFASAPKASPSEPSRTPSSQRVQALSQTMDALDGDDDEPRTKMIDGAAAAAMAGGLPFGDPGKALPFGAPEPVATTVVDAAKIAAALDRPMPFAPSAQQPANPGATTGLPFARSPAQAPSHQSSSSFAAVRDPGAPQASHQSSSSFAAVRDPGAGPTGSPAQAPQAQAASGKIFTLNQFASLTAEIAESPERVADIRRKYGVTEAQHQAESQRWTEDFAMNSELRQRYFGVVSRYRSYLKNKT